MKAKDTTKINYTCATHFHQPNFVGYVLTKTAPTARNLFVALSELLKITADGSSRNSLFSNP